MKVVGTWEVEGENGKTPVLRPYDVSGHYVEMYQTYSNDILDPFMPLPRALHRQSAPRLFISSKTTILECPPISVVWRDHSRRGVLDLGQGGSFKRDELGRRHL